MRIHTLWGERRDYEGGLPELMVAWDMYSWDANPEGFDAECETVKASWGHDLVQWRLVEIEVDKASLIAVFARPVINGDVIDEP